MPELPGKIRAVVFDIDDTLCLERDYVRSGYRAVAEALRLKLGRDEPPELFQSWLWRRFHANRHAGAIDALNEEMKLGLSADDISELVNIYREHLPAVEPLPHAAGMLSVLHAEFRLGVVSDGYLPGQRLKFESLKLGRFFDAVVFTEQLGRECWKPSPAAFEKISELLGVPHELCAYVGDNSSKDFVSPNKLGWLSVKYLLPGQLHAGKPACEGGEPQVIVRSPGELHAALVSR